MKRPVHQRHWILRAPDRCLLMVIEVLSLPIHGMDWAMIAIRRFVFLVAQEPVHYHAEEPAQPVHIQPNRVRRFAALLIRVCSLGFLLLAISYCRSIGWLLLIVCVCGLIAVAIRPFSRGIWKALGLCMTVALVITLVFSHVRESLQRRRVPLPGMRNHRVDAERWSHRLPRGWTRDHNGVPRP